MTDPFASIVPGQQHVIRQSKLQKAIEAYRNNILLRGTTLVDHNVITDVPIVGDDGQPLTTEQRHEIAAKRAPPPVNPLVRKLTLPDGRVVFLDITGSEVPTDQVARYDQDLRERKVEELGASAQREIEKQPEMLIVRPREAKLP